MKNSTAKSDGKPKKAKHHTFRLGHFLLITDEQKELTIRSKF